MRSSAWENLGRRDGKLFPTSNALQAPKMQIPVKTPRAITKTRKLYKKTNDALGPESRI